MLTPLIAMLLCPGQTTLEIQAWPAEPLINRRTDQIEAESGDFDDWTAMRERFCSLAENP